MKGYQNENRKINNENLFNIDRLGLIDTLESGHNLTLGLNYRKENIDDINKYFELNLGKVLRSKINNDIPLNSTLNKKNSNYFGKLTNNLNENLNFSYEFSVDNNLEQIQYNSFGTTLRLRKIPLLVVVIF